MFQRVAASVSLIFASFYIGCEANEGIHASQLDANTETPIQIFQLDQTLWHADILIEDEAIQADTTADMLLEQQEGDAYSLYLSHTEGSIVASSTDIPADTWLLLDASLIQPEQRIFAEITKFGHTMSVDLDIYNQELAGYVTIDAQKAFFVIFEKDLSYRGDPN